MDRDDAIATLRSEGLDATEWTDEPGTGYDEHEHPFREVRIVLKGEITFAVDGVTVRLEAGDRLDLAPMQAHSAKVGPRGVRYLAGTDRRGSVRSQDG